MPDDSVERRDALDAAARHAARLVHAVGWLAVLVEPGREPRPAPPLLTDEQLRLFGIHSAAEARDRAANIRAGLSALPAGPVPVRLGMLTAMARAVRSIGRIVERVDRARPPAFGEPVTERSLVRALDWLAGDGGPPCWTVTAAGVIDRRGVLAEVDDLRVVDRAATLLREAADDARAAAGITDERVAPYPNQPCPACRRRSLEIDATLRNELHWTVICRSEACICVGPGCPCFRRSPMAGRRHAWSYGELPLLAAAQERHRRSNPVRSGTAGHGGWADRRTGRGRP